MTAQLTSLLSLWHKEKVFSTLAADFEKQTNFKAQVYGLQGSAATFFLAALAGHLDRKVLLVCADLARAEKVYNELLSFFPEEVWLLPPKDFFTFPGADSSSKQTETERLKFFQWAISNAAGICVAPVSSLITGVLPFEVFKSLNLKIKVNDIIDREILIKNLVQIGYERAALAEEAGQFSARGDIVDIYVPGLKDPVRLELFDDQIEALRYYSALNQRAYEKIEEIFVTPARELVLPENYYTGGALKIEKKLEKTLSALRKAGETEQVAKIKQKTGEHLERLKEPGALDLLSSYLPFFFKAPVSLLSYLPEESLVVIEEPSDLKEKAARLLEEISDYEAGLLAEGELLSAEQSMHFSAEELFQGTALALLSVGLFSGTQDLFLPLKDYQVEARSVADYHGQWALVRRDLHTWQTGGYQVVLAAEESERGQRLIWFVDEQIASSLEAEGQKTPAPQESFKPGLLKGAIEEGFVIPGLKLVVLTEANITARKKKKKRRRVAEKGLKIGDYRELVVGDYVVHEHHGIGLYQGISALETGGVTKDYLLLKYRGTDKLYLPVEQISVIQKYSGGEGPSPRLHSLGGTQWQRLKKRVSQAVEELAKELLQLYAARRLIKGHSFGPDQPWQQDFEAAFPYEETPDQLSAVAAVKKDLESSYPMDRLICGDVGYGKTEVAMRAAFKVVMEGKQVAVLVPTTVLAQQHYRTFSERFKDFPVKISQLSRFVSPAAQKKVLEDLKTGKTDLVIGTHRLFSGDVSFADLGLLVVDEEQRFGVRQKERLKQLRLKVDTLAMTATPIPRTLHMSLSGARDLSVIETPPENRYPIQTYVAQYSEHLVREAVERELNRQGQVFIVFNRVEHIDRFAEGIRRLFPEAEVAVGHGQMPERRLEKVMADFQEGSYQVLVSTTIIESGLDMPNVNTLIIYDADRFGLAQLYQIRGRVGRSSRLAYAYLTYRKNKIISETARQRLKAIKDFTEFGSGLKIALRDLEIRGAGNILGAEQHGFIAEVGYDLYVKLLGDAVAKLKDSKEEEKVLPLFELKVDAHIPSAYIASADQKIGFYGRIYQALSTEELRDIKEELRDRYGTIPPPVERLLAVAAYKIKLAALKVKAVRQTGFNLALDYAGAKGAERVAALLKALPFTGLVKTLSLKPLKVVISTKNQQSFSFEQITEIFETLLKAAS